MLPGFQFSLHRTEVTATIKQATGSAFSASLLDLRQFSGFGVVCFRGRSDLGAAFCPRIKALFNNILRCTRRERGKEMTRSHLYSQILEFYIPAQISSRFKIFHLGVANTFLRPTCSRAAQPDSIKTEFLIIAYYDSFVP